MSISTFPHSLDSRFWAAQAAWGSFHGNERHWFRRIDLLSVSMSASLSEGAFWLVRREPERRACVRRQMICDVSLRDRGVDLAHLAFMLCDLAAVVQASSFNGAAVRRRTSARGELRGGLSLLHRPQVCVFRLTRYRCFNHSSPCPRLSASRHEDSSSGGILFET